MCMNNNNESVQFKKKHVPVYTLGFGGSHISLIK